MDTRETHHDLANPACLARLCLLKCKSNADAEQRGGLGSSGRCWSALWALSMEGFSPKRSMFSSWAIKSLGLGIYFPSDIPFILMLCCLEHPSKSSHF